MIVYGDPQFNAPAREIIGWLRSELRSLDPDDLPQVRSALIKAGQVEQAVADASDEGLGEFKEILPRFQTATDLLARGVLAHVTGHAPDAGRWARAARELHDLIDHLADGTAPSTQLPSSCLTVKAPEGFEFYSLYPEQYVVSANRWAADHDRQRPKTALVVGIRAIGTTLSAVVAAALQAMGWATVRLTLRPWGHPFDRRVTLEESTRPSASQALIVDEGPGMSGSSMAAVARTLAARGFTPECMSFFPSHREEPGASTSAEVRHWWNVVPRYCTPLQEMRWRHSVLRSDAKVGSYPTRFCQSVCGEPTLDIAGCLIEGSRALPGVEAPLRDIQSVGGGLWRAFAYREESEWPGVCSRFEAPKFLGTTRTGARVLWRFIGLGSWVNRAGTGTDRVLARAAELAQEGWTVRPLGWIQGFVAEPWIEGTRLTAADAQASCIPEHLARYLVRCAGPPLAAPDHRRAIDRLRAMACHNLTEAFGAGPFGRWMEASCDRFETGSQASYGDGRLAPHEWVRTASGLIIKTDSLGHAADHTVVGAQSVLWDVASVLIEWDLGACSRKRFLAALGSLGLPVDPRELRFYEIAYAAFRLGQTSFCLNLEPARSPERMRLDESRAGYAGKLRSLLSKLECRG